MPDGTVEIRVTGTLDPSVKATADQAAAAMGSMGTSATASATAMAAALAATGGNLKKITPEMLGLGTAAKSTAAAQVAQAAATEVGTVATAVNTSTINSSRAAYESLALVHEALSGRFTRMVGTSTILAQALAGQAATTRAVSFVTSAMGASILGTVAALGLAIASTISFESEQRKLTATALGLGAQSGLTAQQLKLIGESAESSSQSIKQTTNAAAAFAAAGIQNEDTVRQLSNSVEAYSQLIGVKFAEAQKTLAEAMKNPVKGAKELHEQLGILNGDQLEQVQTLVELGDKEQAVALITQALKQREDEAREAGVGLQTGVGELINVLSNLYTETGDVIEGFGREAGVLLEKLIPALHQAAQAHRDVAAAARDQAQNEAQLNAISAKGAAAYAETPEGRAAAARSKLQGSLSAARDALKVDEALVAQGKEKADVLTRDREAIADYTHAVETYLTPVQKKLAADALDVKIAQARHEKNAQLVKDLTEQKALIEQAGQIESNADAKALAAGSGDVAGAKTFPKKGGKGPSIVSEWEEQLHEAEVASGDFFKDQTQAELDFWQSKVGQTKQGSKEWLDVQTKIYDASKALAHQQYDEHIADLNDQLEADRNDFKKFQADWAEKLAFIKSKNGEESTAYKDAHRQMEAEMRQHNDQMIRDELSGDNKEISALRSHLQALQQLRSEYAKIAETAATEQAQGSILAEVTAATRIGQIHQQLAQQEIADAETTFEAEDKLRQKGLADALKAWGTEDDRYKKAKQDELTAEQKFQDQIKLLQAKAVAQQIADIERVKQAYHSYIDGLVSSSTSAFTGLIAGTTTWQQAVSSVFSSLLSTIDSILSRIISNWIVNLVVGKTQQSAINAASVASYAGVAGAAGIASMAAAPFPIDLGAPAFGAAMSAAALAFAPEAALAAGTNLLPRDMVVQAHEGERVIPKADNRRLIELVQMGTIANSAPSAAGVPAPANDTGGGIHVHLHAAYIDRRAVEQFFTDNHHAIGKAAKNYVRMGGSLDPNRR